VAVRFWLCGGAFLQYEGTARKIRDVRLGKPGDILGSLSQCQEYARTGNLDRELILDCFGNICLGMNDNYWASKMRKGRKPPGELGRTPELISQSESRRYAGTQVRRYAAGTAVHGNMAVSKQQSLVSSALREPPEGPSLIGRSVSTPSQQ
jgi:hypothetical protein